MSDSSETIKRLEEKLAAEEQQHRRTEKVQAALYEIADAASAVTEMQQFYVRLHEIIGTLMYARGMFVALYDAPGEMVNFPYYVDEIDPDIPDPQRWEKMGLGEAKGLTAYVLRTCRPLHLPRSEQDALFASGVAELRGLPSADWLGVPLMSNGDAIGAVVVQSYSDAETYTERDLDVLVYVGQHIATALTRARAIEETLQRNNELAILNSVGDAMA